MAMTERLALTVSPAARAALLTALPKDTPGIRLSISARFEHDLSFGTAAEGDETLELDGLVLIADRETAARAAGLVIDYVEGPQGPGFTMTNPNQPPRIVQLSVLELKAMRERGEAFELVDVRTPDERAIAVIDGARLLDAAYHKALLHMDHGTPLVFQCHHGVRSQAAAEYFLQAGFTKVYNLRGGIDAWSALVDDRVARY